MSLEIHTTLQISGLRAANGRIDGRGVFARFRSGSIVTANDLQLQGDIK